MSKDVILITGASSGYGKAMAKKFADAGCEVIITGRIKEILEAVAKEVNAVAFVADATKTDDWEKLYNFILEKYGKLDLLVNNAGGGVSIKETSEQTIEDIDKAIALNLNNVIYGCRQFAPMFKQQKEGTIINISSVCAKHAWPGWSVYAAAKAGVLSYTKGLTTELGPYGIRVSCVIPGAGATNFDANANYTERGSVPALKAEDVADAVISVYNLPKHVWVEEIKVWGIDQIVSPL